MCGRYKHCDLIDAIPGCPPAHARATRTPAFSFVFDPVSSFRNFLPARKRSPRRQFTDHQRCVSAGLSMFKTEQEAREFFAGLRASMPNVGAAIGDHVAAATLSPTDGLSTATREDGHFTFFEFAGTDLPSLFTMLGRL